MKKKLIISAFAATAITAVTLPVIAQQRHSDMREGTLIERFAELDADSDGRVTNEEINARRAAKVSAIDADGDGLLSAEELQAHFLDEASDRITKRVERMMERADLDEDGKLNAAEMMLGARGSDDVPRLMARADADDDGAVSEEEFRSFVSKRGGRHSRGMRDGHHGRGGHDWSGRHD